LLLLLIVVLTRVGDLKWDDGMQVTMAAMPKPPPPAVPVRLPPASAKLPRFAARPFNLKMVPTIAFTPLESSTAAGRRGFSAEPSARVDPQVNSDYLARLSLYIKAHSKQPELSDAYPVFMEADVLLQLDADGNLLSAEIHDGSHYQFVDDDALAQLRAIARFPPPPRAPYLVIIQWTVTRPPSRVGTTITQTRLPNPAQRPPGRTIYLGGGNIN
jgi:TonB family protein